MNKIKLAGVFLLTAWAAVSAEGQSSLAGRYKTGRIVMAPDQDWTSTLPPDTAFEERGDMVVASDGSVFVSNTTQHTIFKLSRDGKFVKKIGQPGQGPGDLNFPGRLSILDEKILVVGGYATDQRISLFDLEGNFIKLVRTGRFTANVTALKNGKVAYSSIQGRMGPKEMVNNEEIFIRDITTGREISVARHEFRYPIIKKGSGTLVLAGVEALVMAPTKNGGLVVGTTQSAILDIYSGEGLKLRIVDLGWTAMPVTNEFRKKTKTLRRREADASGRKLPANDLPIPETLGILQAIWTDADGNLLVCRKTDCLEACSLPIRAYSPEGALLGDFELAPGPFVLSADARFKRIVMTRFGIFGLLELKDDPDGYLHLVRSNYH